MRSLKMNNTTVSVMDEILYLFFFLSGLLPGDPLKSYFSVSNFVFMVQKVIPIPNIVSKHTWVPRWVIYEFFYEYDTKWKFHS